MIASWILKVSTCSCLFLLFVLPVCAAPEIKIRDALLEKDNASDAVRNQVKLRVNIEEKGEPVQGLTADALKLEIDGQPQKINRLEPAKEDPQPTKVVILLDASNSMEKADNGSVSLGRVGKSKSKSEYCRSEVIANCRKAGAIQAIRSLRQTFLGQPIELNLVTFGVEGKGCYFNGDRNRPRGYIPPQINAQLDERNFVPLYNFKTIDKDLETIGTQPFCASTDLYTPIITTLNELEVQYQKAVNSDETEPSRFAVIMLSDGFHSHRRTCRNNTEEKLFQEFEEAVNRTNRRFPVYTIGYGLSNRELAEKISTEFNTFNLSTPIDLQNEFVCPFENRRNFPEVTPWVVDHEKLREISALTNGKYETSGDAQGISRVLNQFVNSILGQYELEYQQANAVPGQSNMAMISWPARRVRSNKHQVRLDYFASLPKNLLFIFTAIGVAGTVGWIAAFQKWSRDLKKP